MRRGPALAPRADLLVVLAVALGLRLAWIAWADVADPRQAWVYDPSFYDRAALRISRGLGFVTDKGVPTAFFPPGYSTLLGTLYWVFGSDILYAKLLNALCGTVTCGFTFAIGLQTHGRAVGLVAAGLVALWPAEIAYTALTLPETVFGAVFSGALYAFVAWNERPARGWDPRWLAFGAILGLASLVKGIALLFVGVPVLLWTIQGGLRPEAWRRAVLMFGGLLVVVGPWTIRNQLQLGHPVLISNDGPYVFFLAHSPVATGTVTPRVNRLIEEEFGASGGEGHAEARIGNEQFWYALQYMFTHPWEELRLIPLRLYHLYEHDRHSLDSVRNPLLAPPKGPKRFPLGPKGARALVRAAFNAWFYTVLGLAVLGFCRAFSPRTGTAFAIPLTWLYYNVLFAVFFIGQVKYHAALVPLLALLAAVAVDGRKRPWRLGHVDRQPAREFSSS